MAIFDGPQNESHVHSTTLDVLHSLTPFNIVFLFLLSRGTKSAIIKYFAILNNPILTSVQLCNGHAS